MIVNSFSNSIVTVIANTIANAVSNTQHYISNKSFYEAMVVYHSEYVKNKAEGKPRPQISEYIGRCLNMIANKLSNKPSYIAYSYKDEFIHDAVENAVRYLHMFNPAKSNNPFAYFTQVIKMAFIRRIKTEQKQQYLKMKSTQNFFLTNQLNNVNMPFSLEDNEAMNTFIKNYEESIVKKKAKASGLEKIFEDEPKPADSKEHRRLDQRAKRSKRTSTH